MGRNIYFSCEDIFNQTNKPHQPDTWDAKPEMSFMTVDESV